MSYLICSMALVVLIIAMPFYFAMERNSVTEETAKRELTEISDYTSNTLANLFYLANSTDSGSVNITKQLIYLPLMVSGSSYTLRITSEGMNALKITSSLMDKPQIAGDSWLVPGLKVLNSDTINITSKAVVAGCYRDSSDFYIWLGVG
jgi:hypothetical protein